jgi:ABC-type spermidine/putrescine transport system permease subunit I
VSIAETSPRLGGSDNRARSGNRPWEPGRRVAFLLIPPFLLLLVMFLLPLGYVLGDSFGAPGGVLASYRNVLSDRSLWLSTLYTLRVALTVTAIALLVSYPVAVLVSTWRGARLKLALSFILIPFWTSTVIRTYAWAVLMQRHGILNSLLMDLGLTDHPLRLIGTDLGMQIAMVHIMLPFMMLPLLSTMRGIDRTYLRAASVLGANPFRQFAHVFLPLSMPGVTAGCLLVFISSLGFYITPALLGGANTMIAVMIEQLVSRLLDWPTASALATILLLATSGLYIVYEGAMRRATGATAA